MEELRDAQNLQPSFGLGNLTSEMVARTISEQWDAITLSSFSDSGSSQLTYNQQSIRCIWLSSNSTKRKKKNPSAPGQQILGLIGDKSDGSSRSCLTVMLWFQGEIKGQPCPQSSVEENIRRWNWLKSLTNQPPKTKRGWRSQQRLQTFLSVFFWFFNVYFSISVHHISQQGTDYEA